MTELRLFALAGILAVSVLSVVVVLAIAALIGWIARLRARFAARPAPSGGSLPPLRTPEAERIVRMRQAAWRLRC